MHVRLVANRSSVSDLTVFCSQDFNVRSLKAVFLYRIPLPVFTLHHSLSNLMSCVKGDKIGLVWRKIFMSKECQFEFHCIIASHALGHPCLLFMASLYSKLLFRRVSYLLVSIVFCCITWYGVQYNVIKFWGHNAHIKVAYRAYVFVVVHMVFIPIVHNCTKFHC